MVDYDKINKTVQELLQLHPDVSEYVLWILTTDYYLKEEKGEDEVDEEKVQALKKQALEAYERAQEELKTTKYENIKIEA